MKVRFIIKEQIAQNTEQLQGQLNTAMIAAISNLEAAPDPVEVQSLINQALQLLNQAAGVTPQTSPTPTLGEKKEKMTKSDEKKREKYVKGMKSSKKDFEKRYGKNAERVMYATATKMAKKNKKK